MNFGIYIYVFVYTVCAKELCTSLNFMFSPNFLPTIDLGHYFRKYKSIIYEIEKIFYRKNALFYYKIST